jgi:uncharacterized membrane protein
MKERTKLNTLPRPYRRILEWSEFALYMGVMGLATAIASILGLGKVLWLGELNLVSTVAISAVLILAGLAGRRIGLQRYRRYIGERCGIEP